MKNSDMKVIAIILSIALFFTIVTSNAVSIASVVFLAKGQTATEGTVGEEGTATTPDAGTATTPGGSTSTTPGGSTSSTADTTAPAANSGSTADTTAPAGNSGSTATPDANQPAGDANKPADNAGAEQWDKAKVFNFYKEASDKITTKGIAGHTRKEWQEVKALDLGAASSVLKPILEGFMKTEDQAEAKTSDKGTEDAMRRMAPCGADMSFVKSATKEDLPNGNYKITIVMNDEDTPKKGSKGIAAMATGILYMEDVLVEVQNISAVKSLNEAKIVYKAYTIVAEMTKDGKFVTIDHNTVGDISANVDVVLIGNITGTGQLAFTSKWYDFKY